MSLWDALRMNMMISYQELVRTFHNTGQLFTISSRAYNSLGEMYSDPRADWERSAAAQFHIGMNESRDGWGTPVKRRSRTVPGAVRIPFR